jgi:hypothetical protein
LAYVSVQISCGFASSCVILPFILPLDCGFIHSLPFDIPAFSDFTPLKQFNSDLRDGHYDAEDGPRKGKVESQTSTRV